MQKNTTPLYLASIIAILLIIVLLVQIYGGKSKEQSKPSRIIIEDEYGPHYSTKSALRKRLLILKHRLSSVADNNIAPEYSNTVTVSIDQIEKFMSINGYPTEVYTYINNKYDCLEDEAENQDEEGAINDVNLFYKLIFRLTQLLAVLDGCSGVINMTSMDILNNAPEYNIKTKLNANVPTVHNDVDSNIYIKLADSYETIQRVNVFDAPDKPDLIGNILHSVDYEENNGCLGNTKSDMELLSQ